VAQLVKDLWGLEWRPGQRLFLYLFSGPRRKGDLAEAVAAICPQATLLSTDVIIDVAHDIACDSMWLQIKCIIASGHLSGTIWSPPCSTFSSARNGHDGGPPPLRGAEADTIYGLPNLPKEWLERVKLGTLLALRTSAGLLLCITHCVPFIFEQPKGRPGRPHMTLLPPFAPIRAHPLVTAKDVDQCRFGALASKRTELLLFLIKETDGTPVSDAPLHCDHQEQSWTVPWSGQTYWGPHPHLTGKQWAIPSAQWTSAMRGRQPMGEFLTKATAAYPADFNRLLAGWLVASVSQTPPGPTPNMVRTGHWGNTLVLSSALRTKRPREPDSTSADSINRPQIHRPARLCAEPTATQPPATIGGMRRTAEAVHRLPHTAASTGRKLAAAIEAYFKAHPAAITSTLASLGDDAPPLNATHVSGVRDVLVATLQPTNAARSPVSETFPGILGAWRAAAGDPDDLPEQWLMDGAPAGVTMEVPSRGIFPSYSETEDARSQDPALLATEEGFVNYDGVETDDHVWDEIQRFAANKWIKEFPSVREATKYLGGPPILSRIGVITKLRLGVLRRRIVIDAKRSSISDSSRKYERVILPRATDAIFDTLEMLWHAWGIDVKEFEWLVADYADAFWHIPLHKSEQRFYVVSLRGRIFVLLRTAQGSRGAPLTWARTAALIGRLTQTMFPPSTLRLNTYVDDPLMAILGHKSLRDRVMATILLTWSALGFALSLKKAKRGTQIVWTSVELSTEQTPHDYIVVAQTKPTLVQEARTLTTELLSGNVIARKLLRSYCGKLSHIASLIFTLRPFVAELWAALYTADTAGAPSGCIWMMQIRHTLLWMQAFFGELQADLLIRRFSVTAAFNQDIAIEIILDASPWGLGGAIFIDGQPRQYFAAPLTHDDEQILSIEIGSCTAQQTVESLAMLVAFRVWHRLLDDRRCHIRVKSDSISALFMAANMTSRGTGPRIVARELALCLARLCHRPDVLEHVPGIANKIADELSRRFEPGHAYARPPALLSAKEITVPPRTRHFYCSVPP